VTREQRTAERTSAFIGAFFGPGNLIWPDQNPDSPSGRRLLPYLQVLRSGSAVPVVLPRRRPGDEHLLTAYVIALDPPHATAVGELLTAFVGPSYSFFNGLPAQLEPDDPVDRAVLDFAGPGVTFALSSPTRETQARAWAALEQMQAVMRQRPVRTWHEPAPPGRLLAEFEVALAAGDNLASVQLLDQLAASGGISATNLAHLQIKRLSRLGLDSELLRMPGLTDVVLADPPVPVRDAVLAAIYTRVVAEPLTAGDLGDARESLIEGGALVPALSSTHLPGLSAEALTVLTLAAWIRGDATMLSQLADSPLASAQVEQLAPALAQAALLSSAGAVRGADAHEETSPIAVPVPASWLELVTAAEVDPRAAEAVVSSQAWREWVAPATEDKAIAAALARLNDDAAERVWTLVGPFVDADGYQEPAAASARELINNALAHDRFGPGDLAGLVALTEIFLRSGPPVHEYTALLDDLGAETDRWAGPDRASTVLDFADLLARSASPDHEAQLRLALALLRPLHDHTTRLEPDLARFAAQLSDELNAGLEWSQPAPGDTPSLPASKVLLYSLDEGVLERTSALLSAIAPGVTVYLSHDHVGSPRLRQHSRNADIIVMATRCAKHAATGFIRANAGRTAVVTEADGSGSASLLSAAVTALKKARIRPN
jgi:hypothetical protein